MKFSENQEETIKSLPYDTREWRHTDYDARKKGWYIRKKDNTMFFLPEMQTKLWTKQQRDAMNFLWGVKNPHKFPDFEKMRENRLRAEAEERKVVVEKRKQKAYTVYYWCWWILRFSRILIFGK